MDEITIGELNSKGKDVRSIYDSNSADFSFESPMTR